MNLESALITKVLESKDISRVLNTKVSNCFSVHKNVWDFIENYYLKFNSVPSIQVVQEKFDGFNPEHIDASVEYLSQELMDGYLKYKLEGVLTSTAKNIDNPREALDSLFAKISALGHQTDIIKDVNLADDYWIRLNSLKERAQLTDSGNEILGIPSGISPIDLLYGGWQSGDFVTVMGWTGAAKSWLSIYLATQAWLKGKTPLYFSLEMDDVQFGYRVDTILAGGALSNTKLMNARNVSVDSYEEWAKTEYNDKHPFYIVTNEGLDEVNQLTVQSKIEQYKPDLVILDYHSLFDDAKNGRTETEKHRNLSKDFKRMAVRFGVPIIDIVAVTMETGHAERPPELNEVAWSKQLAYDSDLVLSLYREGQIVNVEAKKSRRSDLFGFQLQCDFDNGRFALADW